MKKNLLLVLSLLLVIAAASVAVAQSRNRDHPTPINNNEVRGALNGHGGESFYSFTAGPGELTITVEVKSTDGTLAMPFELLEANAADSILCCEFAQAGATGETGRVVKTIKIRSRRTVVLHLTEYEYGAGTFLVRFSGAVVFAGRSETAQGNRIGYNGPGGRMGMPANGTLQIRMRDGSTKEIDLSLVQELSVHP
jgi:opacity protein-like surface antigen